MIFLGLIGAHRTGKTTTGKALAEKLGVPFCETNLSHALKQMGVDPKADLPFADRLNVQNILLGKLVDCYEESIDANAGAPVIVTDRTPIDIAAYTLAEVQRETVTPESQADLERHFVACQSVYQFSFVMGALIQPGIPLIEDPAKAPVNAIYQAHINACMIERAVDLSGVVPLHLVPRNCLEISSRVSDISHSFHSIIHQQRVTQHWDAASQSIN